MLLFITFLLGFNGIEYISNKPEILKEDAEKVSNVLAMIDEKSKTYSQNLSKMFVKYCKNLDETKRRALAIQIMLCEHSKDGRGARLPKYESDDQFLKEISKDDFRTYTTYFTNIDAICYHATHEFQTQDNLRKVGNLFSAINFSTEYLMSLQKHMKAENSKIKSELGIIQSQITEEAEKLNAIMLSLQHAYSNLSLINKMASTYIERFKNAKLYLKVLAVAFIASLLIPNLFIPVLCVTSLMLMIEAHYDSMESSRFLRYLRAIYLALCTTIGASSTWLRLLVIKQRIFGNSKSKYRLIPSFAHKND